MIEMYGPRMKMLKQDDEFVLLLDSFDEKTKTSAIVKITMTLGQLREWADAFARAAAP
jgi:hypothetical protein